MRSRLKLCIPVLGVGAFLGIGNALGFINYTVIWRYFSWTNRMLALFIHATKKAGVRKAA